MLTDFLIYYDILKFRINRIAFKIRNKLDTKKRENRKDCFLDQLRLYNYQIISLKNKIFLIDFNNQETLTYDDAYSLINEHELIKSTIKSAILKKIYYELYQEYPGYILYIAEDDPAKLKYSAFLFPVEEFVKAFVFNQDDSKDIVEIIRNGMGIRYLGTKQHSPTLAHYLFVQLRKIDDNIEQGEIIEGYSNFAAILSILNKEPNEQFDFLTLVPENVEIPSDEQEKAAKIILGDNILDDHITIHEFLNRGN